VRIGLVLEPGEERATARLAEEHGLFGILAGLDAPLTSLNAAVVAAESTSVVTIAVCVLLGREHPVTVAEEIAVLDNITAGRTVVLADTGELDADEAAEELEVIRRALSCRPLRHKGKRITVPAAIPSNGPAADSISVTPKPTQVEVPVWTMGEAGADVAARAGLPSLALKAAECNAELFVQPAIAGAAGDLEADREVASSWAAAGATHLFLRLDGRGDAEEALGAISRFVIPEVAMPNYPRITSEARLPLRWPQAEMAS
jgi:alkanesulfonate monooxygenase SsuD/methylene tetrahydromethanopterin reductase-like flavin-dependent oxidoreductase (luciferase family)